MEVKNISYFRPNPSTNETIKILDCGYHETLQGHYSAQKVVDHFVLHFIISGKGTYQVHDQTYHLRENDCFLLLPHVPIRYQSDPEDPWVYYWVGFDGADALELMQLCNISYQIPILHYESVEELTGILKPLTVLNTSSISDSYIALGEFYLLCSKLMQYHQNIKSLSRKEYYVNQKETMGITIQEYITNLKLKRARYFLSNSDFSCADIAFYCGYISEQYFSMAFKKGVGMSPSSYRKQALDEKRAALLSL